MLILASQSPIRRKLLSACGLAFHCQASGFDETAFRLREPHHSALGLAETLALNKARTVSTTHPAAIVIGADQTLECQGQQLEQPFTPAKARQQLLTLRNQKHSLHSAVAVTKGEKLLFSHTATAHLTMRNFSDSFLDDYMAQAGAEILHCVGSYQLEGLGTTLFETIDGDYFTVLGLPLLPLLGYLRKAGHMPS